MLIRSLKGLLVAGALVHLAGCSTPMDAPGRLYPSTAPNTSAQAVMPAAATPPAPAAQTMPVASPTARAPAIRIGLLLPLRSEALGPPANALRAGFMAGYERDREGYTVNLIETGDGPDDALAAYTAALKDNDIVVGPLARSDVKAIAASGMVGKPTLALNHPDGVAIPPNMLVMGLSIEDEARQVAQWAARDHPGAIALIVSGPNSWQRRLASAFAAQWKQLGNASQVVELMASNGYLSEAGINALKLRVDADPPRLLFAALDADQLRQVRGILGSELPAYGTSSVNPGTEPGMALAELDNLRLLDMPWQVQSDHPAVMVYPRRASTRGTLDLDRLYALGIDAFRVAREIALKGGTASFDMDGVTGRLKVSFGQGAARFERIQAGVVYQDGAFKLADKRR